MATAGDHTRADTPLQPDSFLFFSKEEVWEKARSSEELSKKLVCEMEMAPLQ